MKLIGEQFPESWRTVRLGDFVDSEKGKKPKYQQENPDDRYIYPYIDIEAFEENIIKSYADGENCRFCSKDDFLMVWDGSRSGLVGKGKDGALGSTLVRIKFPGILNDYAYYFLQSKYLQINSRTKGSGTPHVDPDLLWNYSFPIPPKNEQHRIVDKIEELFSELDKGIESLKTAREQLEVYRQALLKHAFEGKMTEEWRKENADNLETADHLLERIKQKRESRYQQQIEDWKTAVQKWLAKGKEGKKPSKPRVNKQPCSVRKREKELLPKLPELWGWVTLEELVSGLPRSMQSGPFGSNLKHSEFQEAGVLVIGIDNVRDGDYSEGSQNRISEEKFLELKKYQARPGDLLVTVMASLGRTCVVPKDIEKAIITKHVYRITLEQDYLLPEFFNLVLQSHTVSRKRMFENAQGQTRPGLNSSILKELPMPLCSLKEQNEIHMKLDEKLVFLEKINTEIEDNLKRTEALRQSILKKAFSGQLVPQYPNDEPASVLLERITAEKAKATAKQKKAPRKRGIKKELQQ